MTATEFKEMVEDTPAETRIIAYYCFDEWPAVNSKLVAACLTDVLDDGLSMLYSFFDPELGKRSLGTFMILDHFNLTKSIGLDYVYLGYWLPESPKMRYKSNFSASEVYVNGNWEDLEIDARKN